MKKFVENHSLFILFLKMAVILCGAMILGLLMRGIGVLLLRYWLEVNETIILVYDIALVLAISKIAYHVCHETYLQAKAS